MRQRLPVFASRAEILGAVASHQVVVVAGETGCGKTTQIPQFLLDSGACADGIVGVTEPRRIAATSVAAYVASQRGCEVGGEVGYQIRHDRSVGPSTRIKYMTEGVLLREFLDDRDLRRYGVLVLDEVHERNVNQDVIMALVRSLCARRPDLRVVVMSATINERRFAEYFGAPVVSVPGRTHPVEVRYRDRVPDDYVDAAVDGAVEMLGETDGDVLVFVPDYASIRMVMEGLGDAGLAGRGIGVMPLFGNQSPAEQLAVFERTGRTVIVATNVAETSVTLDGVTAVVDTGKIKEMRYYPSTAVSSLKVVDHSRAGCDQRAGRAGRTAPGICLRLFTERRYLKRQPYTEPEILRSNLDQVLLQLKAMGFGDEEILGIDYLDQPRPGAWTDAKDTLLALGALDEEGLTPTGEMMAEIPLPPVVSRMVLAARDHRCVDAVVTIAASFSTRPVFIRPPGREGEADDAHRRFFHPKSDFLTLLTTYREWCAAPDREAYAKRWFLHEKALEEIQATSAEIRGILEEHGLPTGGGSSPEAIGKAVTAGLIGNLLVSDDGRTFRTSKRAGIGIHPGSSVFMNRSMRYAVCAEVVETTRLYARNVQEVPSRWLQELAPDRYRRQKRGKRKGGRQKKQRYVRGRGRR